VEVTVAFRYPLFN